MLWRGSSGTAGTEHAIFIALIIGALLLTVEGLNLLAEHTFSTAASGLAGETTGVAQRAERPAKQADGDTAVSAASTRGLSSTMRFSVLLVACTVGIVCWWLVYRINGRKAPATAETETANDDTVEIDHDAIFEKRHKILRILSADVGILLDSRMHVEHLMSRRLATIAASKTAQQVRDLMEGEKIRHLIVCEPDGRLVGVISDRDLRKAGAKTARDLMTANPLTVEPDSLVSPAVTLLIKRRISCLPVVKDERVVGVLTTTDLLMALQCALHALQKVASEIADVHAQGRQLVNRDMPAPTTDLVA